MNYTQGLAFPLDYNRYQQQTAVAGSANQYHSGLGNALAPSIKNPPQIAQQEVELSARLDSQEKLLSILEEKLQPVMGMYPVQESVPSPGPTLASCPLAARLQGMALRISSLNSSIQSLIDRVEV